MIFFNSLNNVVDRLFDYIDPIECHTMSPNYAAYVIQHAYRKHLIKKYFKHLKYCVPFTKSNEQIKINSSWFF